MKNRQQPQSAALYRSRCNDLAPVGGNQNVARLPRLGHVSDTGREFADAFERMSRREEHGKKRPAHLHLARQINAVHDAAKPDVREDHGDLTPADQQSCERRFCAFALDGVHWFVFEQRRGQAAEFGVVLDDQYGSTFLLRLPHVAPLSVRRDRHSIGA